MNSNSDREYEIEKIRNALRDPSATVDKDKETSWLGPAAANGKTNGSDTALLAANNAPVPIVTPNRAMSTKDAARVTMVSYKVGPAAGAPLVEPEEQEAEEESPAVQEELPKAAGHCLPLVVLFALRQAGGALPEGSLPGPIPVPSHWLFIGADPFSAGLGPHCLCIQHEAISQAHCCVMEFDGSIYACDLGSTNGTWRVSPSGEFEALHAQPTVMYPGDFLMMGEVALQIVSLMPAYPIRPAIQLNRLEPGKKKNAITRTLKRDMAAVINQEEY